jgi:hypothetical protein
LLQELNATQFNITGTRFIETDLDGVGTGQRLRDTDFPEEQLKGHKTLTGRMG